MMHASQSSPSCFQPHPRRFRNALLTSLAVLFIGGCPDCNPPPATDAGIDAGLDPDVNPADSGTFPDGGTEPFDAGPQCTPETEGFGDPCAANPEDPLCGNWICNPQTDELFCYDLGPNDCGGCDELDTSEGRIGEGCGEFGCGNVICNEEGTATLCVDDHPRNQCGGCGLNIPEEYEVGESCSQCQSGERTCTRDLDKMVCWQGRSQTNSCGGCGRCVLFHAYMDERFSGGYLKSGTLALIEDIGDGVVQLVFDPLVEGPGANGLVLAQVMLSSTPDSSGSLLPLNPGFAESLSGGTADPVRSYNLFASNPALYQYVLIYDNYLQDVISAGALIPGPPSGLDISPPDLPPLQLDGGVFLPNDGGTIGLDAGSADAGNDAGATTTDAGSTTTDAGSTTTDAGSTSTDAGSTTTDAGSTTTDAG